MTTPVTLVEKFYTALGARDIPTILTLLDSDLHWTEAERFPYYGGTWRSPQDMIDNLLVPLDREWKDFSAEMQDFIAQGERVVAFGAYSGTYRKTGRAMSSPFAHVWRTREGRLTHFTQYTDTAKVIEALRPAPDGERVSTRGAIVAIQRTSGVVRRQVRDLLNGYGLTMSQLNVLRILRRSPSALPTMAIHARLQDHEPGITRLLDALQRRGFIERMTPAGDRRRVDCRITARGRRVLRDLDGPFDKLERAMLSKLSATERRRLTSLLHRVERVGPRLVRARSSALDDAVKAD